VHEHGTEVRRALAREEVELADALIHAAGRAHGCERAVTFDRDFAGTPGVESLRP